MLGGLEMLAVGAAIGSPLHTVEGAWVTADRRATIVISRCGPTLCGRVDKVAADPLGARDRENPRAELRDRALVGLEIFSAFRPVARGWRGQLYNPLDGRTYKATLSPAPLGALNVKACLGPFCGKEAWTRAAPDVEAHEP